ncbi:hypothetical protein BD779DRAFT_1501774 [Infundibulicybe gibba]|nr:hypothetical protein BD779DRAFT_1501774 [Infundibulicybe gibba]
MQNFLVKCRFIFLGLFIIWNAIITSVSVWNFSLAQSNGFNAPVQVDVYTAFIGAFSLVFVFIIIFADLGFSTSVISQVWFECTWLTLLWSMHLAGAIAFSTIASGGICNAHTHNFVIQQCSSSQVLLAFIWISTITLLAYLSLLAVSALIHARVDKNVWFANVKSFSWSNYPCRLASPPATPSLPYFRARTPVIAAPRPQRAHPVPEAIYSYRSGLDPQYQIEHYHPPSPTSTERPYPPIPAAAPPHHQAESTRQAVDHTLAASLYPQYIQSSLVTQPPPVQLQPVRSHNQASVPPTPPPLGNWPHPNAVSQPMPSRRRNPANPVPAPSAAPPSSINRSRPTGPRRRSSSSGDMRPPPLDLSLISTFTRQGDA